MRWVVSLLVLLLVFPIAAALDISFDSDETSYKRLSPVEITFTTDTLTNCTYTLTQNIHSPDFSCSPRTCTYNDCNYACQDTQESRLIKEGARLQEDSTNYLMSFTLDYGWYDTQITCSHGDAETTTKKFSFLHDSSSIHLYWSLLTRERFSPTQSSIYYAFIQSDETIDEVTSTLTYPDETTYITSLGSIQATNGYLYSYDLENLPIGPYTLEINISYASNNSYILNKDFSVVPADTFIVSSSSDSLVDIEFIDPISKIPSFRVGNVSTKKIAVPASRLDTKLYFDEYFAINLANLDMINYDLSYYYTDEYVLQTNLIGENKPLKSLSSYIFYTNESPEYISQIIFNYSAYDIKNPQELEVFKAKATSYDDVNLDTGKFYKVGSQQTPLYIDEENSLAYMYTADFGLFSLVAPQQIGDAINRNASRSFIAFSQMKNTTLEGIARDIWNYTFKEKEYSFLINAIDGAIVHFEFSPDGQIVSANVGKSFHVDIDKDFTDDLAFYVHAITPSKIIFYVSLLPQPEEANTFIEAFGQKIKQRKVLRFSSGPLFYTYLGLILLILFFAIVWFIRHGHKKPSSTVKLSKQEIEHIEQYNSQTHPIIEYIKKLESEGMEHKYIRAHLITVGWPQDIVDVIMKKKSLTPESNQETMQEQPSQIHSLQEQTSVSSSLPPIEEASQESQETTAQVTLSTENTLSDEEENLLAYVQRQVGAGVTLDELKAKLEHVGWPQESIERVLNKVSLGGIN